MGLNEFAGYLAVAAAARSRPGCIAARYGLRPEPFYLGVGFVARRPRALGARSSARRTHHVAHEATAARARSHDAARPSARCSGGRRCTTANLSSVSQAGLVNNLNDGMAWGLFPLFFAAARTGPRRRSARSRRSTRRLGPRQLVTGACPIASDASG